LKEAEEAASSGNGKRHAPEFAEHLVVPTTSSGRLTHSAETAELVEDGKQARIAMRGKGEDSKDGVNNPTKKNLASGVARAPLAELLEGRNILPLRRRVVCILET
jgi:hypothetical protein